MRSRWFFLSLIGLHALVLYLPTFAVLLLRQNLRWKIWVHYDGTNRPVAEALLAAGVPREDIVLGFHPAQLRQYTDFAAA